MRRKVAALVLLVAACGPSAVALETDQFYAWTRPLQDSTDVLNAKVNLEIARVLERVNGSDAGHEIECPEVASRISSRFRFFVFHEFEMWVGNTQLVDRIPATAEEERDYRRSYLFRHLGRFDFANWVPPTPTVEIDGVRVGTDKLSHFFSEGLLYYKAYLNGRKNGLSHEEAELRSVDLGIRTERSILGQASSGVFSAADLEANHEGLLFLLDLCDAADPVLERSASGWRATRPFDWRDHVTPEWDESYQPFALSQRRWKQIRRAMIAYCDDLSHPAVRSRREAYARRETLTLTERRIRERVAAGRMPDPADFSIESACSSTSTATR